MRINCRFRGLGITRQLAWVVSIISTLSQRVRLKA